MNIDYAREKFPAGGQADEFLPLWESHGLEVAGKPFDLNMSRYHQIEREGRLVWIVARSPDAIAGYSCHFWYTDMHFNERVAADDMWYVAPVFRGLGIGKRLKETGLACLKDLGVSRAYDLIRGGRHPKLMLDLGYKEWGTRWVREL